MTRPAPPVAKAPAHVPRRVYVIVTDGGSVAGVYTVKRHAVADAFTDGFDTIHRYDLATPARSGAGRGRKS